MYNIHIVLKTTPTFDTLLSIEMKTFHRFLVLASRRCQFSPYKPPLQHQKKFRFLHQNPICAILLFEQNEKEGRFGVCGLNKMKS